MNKKQKRTVFVLLAVLLIAALSLSSCGKKNTLSIADPKLPEKVFNPLTGEDGFNKDAAGKRPVAIVVENLSPARPQMGIDDKEKAPDIILEGEVEGGIPRMLWFFADYTAVPDKVLPIRSARPPYIQFSQLFDAIFVHWGLSSSGGGYVGANDVFINDKVDHIDAGAVLNTSHLFAYDDSRFGRGQEHAGILYGKELPGVIKSQEYRVKEDSAKYTKLPFHQIPEELAGEPATSVTVNFSSRMVEVKQWDYNADDGKYHTSDYDCDVTRDNLLILMDQTVYQSKSSYKGMITYCTYQFAGGEGYYCNGGKYVKIKWAVKDGKLSITDADGKEIEFNPGKTWIGWGSSNNGGTVTIK